MTTAAEVPPQPQGLPEKEFILILKRGPKGPIPTILNLDEFDDTPQDKNIKRKLYVDALEKNGIQNVRYCRVVQSKIQTVVSLEGE
jgi:hypothetical protein